MSRITSVSLSGIYSSRQSSYKQTLFTIITIPLQMPLAPDVVPLKSLFFIVLEILLSSNTFLKTCLILILCVKATLVQTDQPNWMHGHFLGLCHVFISLKLQTSLLRSIRMLLPFSYTPLFDNFYLLLLFTFLIKKIIRVISCLVERRYMHTKNHYIVYKIFNLEFYLHFSLSTVPESIMVIIFLGQSYDNGF